MTKTAGDAEHAWGTTLGLKMASIVLRQSNRLSRTRDALYLDTNAWSLLAKGEIPWEPLLAWVEAKGFYLWIARFQIAELSNDTRLARPMAELLRHLPVVLVDRGQNELLGEHWYKVKADLELFLLLTTQELVDEFIDQVLGSPIRDAVSQVASDAADFRAWLEQALASIPPATPRTWESFPARLERWIRSKCDANGVAVREDALASRECYIGLRLAFSVLFLRYFVNQQRWKPGDYVDFLHAYDMAYSAAVITERNMAECIRQAARRPEVLAPAEVHDLSWLRDLKSEAS